MVGVKTRLSTPFTVVFWLRVTWDPFELIWAIVVPLGMPVPET
jgi:hypothetical protein